MLKRALLVAAESDRLEQKIGTDPRTKKLVERFVAGTTLRDAVRVTKEMNAKRIWTTFDLLGETVTDLSEADAALAGYLEAIPAIASQCPGNTLSVKLSQLGIGLDPAACDRHLKTLIEAASAAGVTLEIDMEHSSVGRPTLEAYRRVLADHPGTRVAIQAAMRSTPDDLRSFTGVQPRIRLVKGAFLESPQRCLQARADITEQYNYLVDGVMEALPDPAFGTHDDACIEAVKRAAQRHGKTKDDFEFQMLYGVRRDLQQRLADEGYRVRVYVPYGTDWYPYLMRRMAERPANLAFFLRSLIGG